ncbi:uncharacterized protein PpBr36_06148 [Pyricularia pennisetigena]|uniref:uncharacterized protein n=1 Tax=Pyricularia pennisetigena TaxID=1578925 RepID=UPI00114E41F5|nr:uncharacterized protein PpBr36_06148 [Pyricularia pennisetigena]TLS23117.1 hypothetical protein PpBr36_06148 [Pyricularia pennisetigena]
MDSEGDHVAKRRAPMSCDRCKSRKTKAGGFCDGNVHTIMSRSPEEEFRLMTRALSLLLPGTPINLDSLRELVHSLERRLPTPTENLGEPLRKSRANAGASNHRNAIGSGVEQGADKGLHPGSAITIDEIDHLQKELGWLTIDSKGTPRHVGLEGGYGFNAAVRSLNPRQRANPASSASIPNDLVTPLTAAPPCPPEAPVSAFSVTGMFLTPPKQIFLPMRELCLQCVDRFFREIHPVYWLFRADTFYAALDRIYARDSNYASPSMLCSIYAILALTTRDSEAAGEATSSKYLALAKSLVPALFDEANVDTIRALCILSSINSNTAYAYIGAASRIALTLGLNLSKSMRLRSNVHGQSDLRIFCSLYMLDLEVALCYGNPPSLVEEDGAESVQFLLEQVLEPGSNMPPDYLAVSCQLSTLKRGVNKLLYLRPSGIAGAAADQGRSGYAAASISSVTEAISSIQRWFNTIPLHLRNITQASPYHQRSIATLHLRYWSTLIFVTQRGSASGLRSTPQRIRTVSDAKRQYFKDFSALCLEAASQSLRILCYMRDAELLSSLVTLDTSCLLEDLQVFLLALSNGQDTAGKERQEKRTMAISAISELLHTLQGMDQIFWTRHVLVEVMAQLEEHGLINGDSGFNPGHDSPGLYSFGIASHHDIVSGMMESYGQDGDDPLFHLPDF